MSLPRIRTRDGRFFVPFYAGLLVVDIALVTVMTLQAVHYINGIQVQSCRAALSDPAGMVPAKCKEKN